MLRRGKRNRMEDEEFNRSGNSPEKIDSQSQEKPRLFKVLPRSGGRGGERGRRVEKGRTEVYYEQEQFPPFIGGERGYVEEKVH